MITSTPLTDELKHVNQRVRVLRDRVLIKPLPYMHPVLLTPGVEIQKGVVVAVGYGRRQRRKTEFRQAVDSGAPVLGPNGREARFAPSKLFGRALWFEDGAETGAIIPMDIAPGDVVEFSFRNLTRVDFDRLGFSGVGELVFVWRKAIYSIDPDASLSDCLLWQQSAGYDRNGNFMSGAESWTRA